MTRAELLKLYVTIDLKSLRVAYLNGGLPGGEREYRKLEQEYVALINSDITDADIQAAANGDLGSLEGLDGLFKKIGSALKKAAKAVGSTIKKVVTGAAKVATQATLTGAGVGVSTAVALKALEKTSTRAFLYAFIPDGSLYLLQNPEVKRKKAKAMSLIRVIDKRAIYSSAYIMKLIRNNTIDHYRKTPEQLIKEMSEGKEIGLGITEPISLTAVTAVIAALAPIAAMLIEAGYKKEDVPLSTDWKQTIDDLINVTGEPLKEIEEKLNEAGKELKTLLPSDGSQPENDGVSTDTIMKWLLGGGTAVAGAVAAFKQ